MTRARYQLFAVMGLISLVFALPVSATDTATCITNTNGTSLTGGQWIEKVNLATSTLTEIDSIALTGIGDAGGDTDWTIRLDSNDSPFYTFATSSIVHLHASDNYLTASSTSHLFSFSPAVSVSSTISALRLVITPEFITSNGYGWNGSTAGPTETNLSCYGQSGFYPPTISNNFAVKSIVISGAPTTETIALTFPADTSTLQDFPNFEATASSTRGVSGNSVCVDFDRNSSSTFSSTRCTTWGPLITGGGDYLYTIPKPDPLWFAPMSLSGALWWARARYLNPSGGSLATSTVTYFTVVPGTSTSTQNLINPDVVQQPDECSISTLGTCFSQFMQYLFVPSGNSLNQFSNLSLTTRFPFSYWFSLKSAIDTATVNASSSFPELIVYIPKLKNASTTYTTTTIFSASRFIAYAGQTNFDLFYNLFRWGFWLFFGYYLFERFRTIL